MSFVIDLIVGIILSSTLFCILTASKNINNKGVNKMKVKVNLNTMSEIQTFTQAVRRVKPDVRLVGKDENGNGWSISAKSLLAALVITERKYRSHNAHDVDWNTIYCECDEDIYNLIQKFVG